MLTAKMWQLGSKEKVWDNINRKNWYFNEKKKFCIKIKYSIFITIHLETRNVFERLRMTPKSARVYYFDIRAERQLLHFRLLFLSCCKVNNQFCTQAST